MKISLKKWWSETTSLFNEIPLYIIITFSIVVIAMNMLSNITLYQSEFLAIDGGFIISWIIFLIMDLITIHFGPKASIKLTIFAIAINLLASGVFALIGLIPGVKDNPSYLSSIGGTWFILISSSVAFFASGVINSILNYLIGKLFSNNPKSKLAFVTRSYISTLVGQFIDNLIFATMTFMLFAPIFWNGFHWTITQCLTCSILFAVIELIMEIIFSPIAYRISKRWTEKGIGEKN